MNFRPYIVVFAMLAASGCAATSDHARTLPGDAHRGLAYLPSDAFVAGRVDVRAMRAVPGWGAIEVALTATRPEDARGWLSTDVAYFAIGGLVDVPLPPAPPAREVEAIPAPTGVEQVAPPTSDPSAADPSAADLPAAEHTWVEMARSLGGRLPLVVVTLEGRDVSRCMSIQTTPQVREAHGFRIATADGFSVALAGSELCVITFEPLIDRVLAAQARTPRIVSRLLSETALVGFAVEFGSEASRRILAAVREEAARGVRAVDPSDVDEREVDDAEDGAAIRYVERLLGVLGEGVEAIEWQLGRSGASFASRTRIYADDMDRGIMWRELTEMTLAIIVAFGESGLGGIEASHVVDTLSETTSVEEADDGFVLVTRMSDDTVTGFVDALVSEGENAYGDEAVPDVGTGGPNDDLFDIPELPAAERMVAIQTKLDAMLDVPEYARWPVVFSLTDAYAHLGRFDDAGRLLEQAVGLAPADERWEVRLALVELYLAWGRAEEALAVVDAQLAECAASWCGYEREVNATRGLVLAMRGDDDGLERFDAAVATTTGSSDDFIIMRARIIAASGSWDEAFPLLDALMAMTREPEYQSLTTRASYVEALARSRQPLERVLAANARVFAADDASGIRRDEITTRLYFDCLARALRAPTASTSRDACRVAVDRATAENGATHPLTASASLEYARVLAASRDSAGATRALVTVVAALATLGPAHPLRARRAALRSR